MCSESGDKGAAFHTVLRKVPRGSQLLWSRGLSRSSRGSWPTAESSQVTYTVVCFFLINLFLWLCWVFVSVRGPSPVVASRGHSSSRCVGPSPSRPLLLQSTGSRRAGSVVVANGPSCSAACGIFPDQGSNPCPLHWQADSQPLRHQGSPILCFWSSKRATSKSHLHTLWADGPCPRGPWFPVKLGRGLVTPSCCPRERIIVGKRGH